MTKEFSRKKLLFITLFLCILIAGAIIILLPKRENGVSQKHRLQWWLSAINWDKNRLKETGDGIRVAILDSGVDATHPDLQGKIETEYRVPALQGEVPGDVLHGTAVAAILAAEPASEKGVLGVAVNAKIISVDVTDQKNGTIELDHLIDGIRYAVSMKADIISISAGVKKTSDELHRAIKEAYEAGIVIIAASGNYMVDDLLYPAKYKEVIAAGALSKDMSLLSPKGSIGKNVVYLPGENIVTAGTKGGYTGINGTSAAAPILSGIVALMKEKNRQLTNDEIISYFDSYISVGVDVRKCMELKYK